MTTPALVTGAGIILATAAHMCPEQARGKTAAYPISRPWNTRSIRMTLPS